VIEERFVFDNIVKRLLENLTVILLITKKINIVEGDISYNALPADPPINWVYLQIS
jgi:hypothetical protein